MKYLGVELELDKVTGGGSDLIRTEGKLTILSNRDDVHDSGTDHAAESKKCRGELKLHFRYRRNMFVLFFDFERMECIETSRETGPLVLFYNENSCLRTVGKNEEINRNRKRASLLLCVEETRTKKDKIEQWRIWT
jgi:hypothetical protein